MATFSSVPNTLVALSLLYKKILLIVKVKKNVMCRKNVRVTYTNARHLDTRQIQTSWIYRYVRHTDMRDIHTYTAFIHVRHTDMRDIQIHAK